MYKRIIEISSSFSKDELTDVLKKHTEEASRFNYMTTGNKEDKFFLGWIGSNIINVKKNIFESQPQRSRYTLNCKGGIEPHGTGSKLKLELHYFTAQSSINKIGIGIFLVCLLIIPFSYDTTNLVRILIVEGSLLLILSGLIWSLRVNFNKVADDIETKLKEIICL